MKREVPLPVTVRVSSDSSRWRNKKQQAAIAQLEAEIERLLEQNKAFKNCAKGDSDELEDIVAKVLQNIVDTQLCATKMENQRAL